ncbi:MAG TPA: hypothetical protein VM889_03070 [Candidatus Thermoplasmatota archaeon]|nr:hypothetical protein [Candidatus Thermoplasmatota archaeon]
MFPRRPPVGARLALVAALALGLQLRLAHAPREPIWDGWRYNLQALALVEGRFETWNHQGFAALAAPFTVVDPARAAWILSLGAGLAGIAVAYGAAARLAGRPAAGAFAAWAVALFPIHVYWSGTGHAGTTAFALALAALWAAASRRPGLAVLATLAAATARPDALALLLGLGAWAIADGSARRFARPALVASAPAIGLAFVFAIGFGAHPGDFSWTVPDENVPLDWGSRGRSNPDGSVALDAAASTLSPAYIGPNLAFYASILARWSLWDWSGWILYLPPVGALALAAVAGLAIDRRLAAFAAATLLPMVAFFSIYYGFSPEYVLVGTAPLVVAAALALERATRPAFEA